MRSEPINLLGGSNVDNNVTWSTEDTVNCLIERASSDGFLTPLELRDAPGLKPYVIGPVVDGIPAGPVRGSHDCEGKQFHVMGSTFYQISNTGIAIPLGTVPGTQRVNMAHNQIPGGNEIIITTGTPNSYSYNTVTQVYGRITDPGYPGGGSVDYIDTYLVSVEPFGRYWFWSDQASATSYNTLNRTEAEADPDSIVALAVNAFEVVVFGQQTVEFFYNAGGINGSTFRSKKVMNNHGCAARDSVVKLDNSLFWLGVDGILYRLNGYQAIPVSTPQFTQRIQGKNWTKAYAYAFEDQGHVAYIITFPDGETFVYDVPVQATTRLESYGLSRWRASTLIKSGRRWVAGDFQAGKLYELDWGYPMEGEGTPMVRERISGNTSNARNKSEANLVELLFQVGSAIVEPVDFVAQPEGPTITGAYPDGVVGIANSAYPYVATGGTPPYTFSNRPGNNPAPGIGVMASTGIVPAGTPTTVGNYEHRPRVTDMNGLFDDLIDPYVVNAMVLALGTPTGVGDSCGVMQIPDITDWDNAIHAIAEAHQMLAAEDARVVIWGNTNHIYSDDLGLTFSTPVGDLGGLAGPRQGCIVDGVIVIPGNNITARTYRSTDNGVSFNAVDQGSNFLWRAVANGSAIYFNTHTASQSRFYVSNDLGLTTSAGGLTNLITSGGGALASFGGKVVCGGRNVFNNLPGVSVTEDGSTIENHDVNSDVNQYTSAICGALVAGVERWVIGLSNGKIYWTEDFLTFTQWTESLSGAVNSIVWNGANFLVGGDNTTYGLTSPDGKAGTQRTPNALGDNISVIVVVR